MKWLAPPIACLMMLATSSLIFLALGRDPVHAFTVFFVHPLQTGYGWGELLIKASPLILIAQGLAIGFRARLYNIGAEGQLTMGAICGSGIAIFAQGSGSGWILPAMVAAGAAGGAAWGAVPALLKSRFNADETLTTLMLNYVAGYFLSWLLHGPWRDPEGMNFPQSVMFDDSALFPIVAQGTRLNASVFLCLAATAICWLLVSKSFLAFRLEVGGEAPAAARYAGFSAKTAIWTGLVLSGLAAGIAGVGEVAGPIGQLNLNISPGYGYAAIIVAWLGRLHPVGIVLAGLLMALLYLGGEAGQLTLQLPAAITGLFQGMLLFYLLGADAFIDNRLRRRKDK